jgi:hypothetical protein
MLNSRWVLLAALISGSSLAGVSFEQKQKRVEALLSFQKAIPSLSFEAYRRELSYEEMGLSVNARAKYETNILADKIRLQVQSAYEASFKLNKDANVAREEVRANIEKDLNLAAPEMKDELVSFAMNTLDTIDAGASSSTVELRNVELMMEKEVLVRKEYLNQEDASPVDIDPVANPSKDSERKDYKSREDLMEALVSTRENSRWVSTSNQTLKTSEIFKTESTISLQVQFEFLGVAIEAGPMIKFKRKYSTNANIMAEGMNPVLYRDGNFDFWKRDENGKVYIKNGKEVKRYIAFVCDADLEFETEYTGAGGFKVLGFGGDTSFSKSYSNSVTMNSRRIALPEYVANKSMTMKYASELCHRDFLNAKFNNSMTVSSSLNVMMRNVVASLTFSHPKTKCAVDENCYNWFNDEVISLVKIKNFPRCGESYREKFRSCQLRGLQGQNCPVYEKGKRTSSGQWEYACDSGLKCVKTESQTFFMGSVWSYAKGKCQIQDKKTYRNPFTEAWGKKGIEVTLQ